MFISAYYLCSVTLVTCCMTVLSIIYYIHYNVLGDLVYTNIYILCVLITFVLLRKGLGYIFMNSLLSLLLFILMYNNLT